MVPSQVKFRYGIPLLVFAVGFVVRLIGLGDVQLGLDEPFTVFHAQMPWADIPSELAKYNNPPLFEMILHPFIWMFGISESAVRIPSLLFGSLACVFVYALGKMGGNRVTGLVAAGIFTFSSQNIYFAHEARVYSLWTLFTLAATYFLLKWMKEPKRNLWLIGWMLASIGMVYSHYFGLIALGLQCLFLLLERIKSQPRMVGKAVLAMLLVVVAYIPQIPTLWNRFTAASGEHWVPLAGVNELYHTLSKYSNRPVITVILLAVLVLGGGYLIWKREKRKAMPKPTLLFLFFFPGAYLFLWAVGTSMPVFLDRYVVFSIPFLYLMVAIVLQHSIPARWASIAGGALVLAMALTTDLAKDSQSQWREVAQHVAQGKTPRTAVLIQPKNNLLAFTYHFQQDWFADYKNMESHLRQHGIYSSMNPDVQQELHAGDYDRIIQVCVRSACGKANPATEKFLKTNTRVFETRDDVHGIDIRHLALEPPLKINE